MRVMVTGAAGYIGSHTALALYRAGHSVLALDNFSNSSKLVPTRLAELTGDGIRWEEGDVRDASRLDEVLSSGSTDAVIHFAGLKSVADSCVDPLAYYSVNVEGTLRLLEAMGRHGVRRLIFSSSATVYRPTQPSPVAESGELGCVSPYGRSKWMAEQLITDAASADGGLRYANLRYFNPVGADESGLIGECPRGVPSNLMPMICRVALGKSDVLSVHGADYQTRDGTGVRDFIHVADVATAHVAALDRLAVGADSFTVNIGTGRGISVLELVRTFERVTGMAVPYRLVGRRPGDVAELVADVGLAVKLLDWRPSHGLEAMCRDAWRWQAANPDGYGR